MRLEKYLNERNIFSDYLILFESIQIDEMSNDTFLKLKSAGKKAGFNITKSKSLVDYFKGTTTGVEDILRYASLYMLTDIKDSKSRKELVKDAKNTLKSINKKDVTNMLIQLDKNTIGVTTQVTNIINSVFGVNIATYNNWLKDAEYLKKTIEDIRVTLKRMEDTEEELKALDKFETSLQDLIN